MKPSAKQHYHLVSGEVMFREPEGTSIGSVKVSTVLRSPSEHVPSRQLGRAQQAMQMLMFQKLGDENLVVIDVHLGAVSYLGYMTEEDFMAPPEGMQLQEVDGGRKAN